MDMLRCLLLPVQDKTLILPYAAITEVIEFSEPTPIPNAPAWLLGKIDWRGLQIPLMSLDGMINELKSGNKSDTKTSFTFKKEQNTRIAIFNRIKQYPFDFLGVVLQGIPRMSRVRKPDLKDQNKAEIPFIISANLRDTVVHIPDLGLIEDRVSKYL